MKVLPPPLEGVVHNDCKSATAKKKSKIFPVYSSLLWNFATKQHDMTLNSLWPDGVVKYLSDLLMF